MNIDLSLWLNENAEKELVIDWLEYKEVKDRSNNQSEDQKSKLEIIQTI